MEYLFVDIVSMVKSLILDSATAISWLTTPIALLGIAPLALFSINGIIIYITIAVAKWFTN